MIMLLPILFYFLTILIDAEIILLLLVLAILDFIQ